LQTFGRPKIPFSSVFAAREHCKTHQDLRE
jgi:hypothetical protein